MSDNIIWKQTELKEVAKIKGGKRMPKGSMFSSLDTGYRYIRVVDMQNMSVNNSDVKYITADIYNQLRNYKIDSNNLYLSIAGTIGKAGIIPNDFNQAILTENAAKLVLNQKIDINYLRFLLNSPQVQDQIKKLTKKMGQPKLALFRAEQIKVMMPYLGDFIDNNSQQQIANKLEILFSEIDMAIEKTNVAIFEADNLFWSFLNKKINNGLTEGWKEILLINITSFFNDGDWVEKRHQSFNGIRLIQTGNVGIIDFRDKEEKRYINEETFNKLRCKDVLPGDILISRLPDPVGRACIIPKLEDNRLVTAVDCTIVRLQKYYVPEFINYLLNSRYSLNQVHFFLSGSSRIRISRKNLEKIKLPIPLLNNKPDTERQKLLAKEFNEVRNLSVGIKDKYKKQLNLLEMMKQSLLNQAFQGKL